MSPPFVLTATGICKTFGEGDARVDALKGVDLQVSEGEFLALTGSSGSGKSTLLNVLAGIEEPTRGCVRIDGTDIFQLNDRRRTLLRRRQFGFVFQSFNLLPTLSAEDNVALPLLLGGTSVGTARQLASEALNSVGLEARRSHLPIAMSGGEQQRVAIARALVTRPRILLADEPTGNLDSANGRRILDLLRQAVTQRKQTLIVATHDLGIAAVADRMMTMRDGLLDGSRQDADMPISNSSPPDLGTYTCG